MAGFRVRKSFPLLRRGRFFVFLQDRPSHVKAAACGKETCCESSMPHVGNPALHGPLPFFAFCKL